MTRDKNASYKNGRMNEKFLKEQISDFSRYFYVCGPDPMVAELVAGIQNAGASPDALVFEK